MASRPRDFLIMTGKPVQVQEKDEEEDQEEDFSLQLLRDLVVPLPLTPPSLFFSSSCTCTEFLVLIR